MKEEKFTEKVNKRLEELFDLYPIDNLQPTEVTAEMRDGLARMFADKGFKLYLENAIKIALKNMAVAPTPIEIAYYKSRVDVLEQLLAKGKQLFLSSTVLEKGLHGKK